MSTFKKILLGALILGGIAVAAIGGALYLMSQCGVKGGASCDRALALLPTDFVRFQMLQYRGLHKVKAGDLAGGFEDQKASAELQLKAYPDSPLEKDVAFGLFKLAWKLNKEDDALRYGRMALKAGLKSVVASDGLAAVLVGRGELDEALAQLRGGRAQGMDSPAGRRLEGVILAKRKDDAGAVAMFESVASEPPEMQYEAAHAASLMGLKRYEEAERHAALALKLDPTCQPCAALHEELVRLLAPPPKPKPKPARAAPKRRR